MKWIEWKEKKDSSTKFVENNSTKARSEEWKTRNPCSILMLHQSTINLQVWFVFLLLFFPLLLFLFFLIFCLMLYLHEIMMSDALLRLRMQRNTFILLSGLVGFHRLFFFVWFLTSTVTVVVVVATSSVMSTVKTILVFDETRICVD